MQWGPAALKDEAAQVRLGKRGQWLPMRMQRGELSSSLRCVVKPSLRAAVSSPRSSPALPSARSSEIGSGGQHTRISTGPRRSEKLQTRSFSFFDSDPNEQNSDKQPNFNPSHFFPPKTRSGMDQTSLTERALRKSQPSTRPRTTTAYAVSQADGPSPNPGKTFRHASFKHPTPTWDTRHKSWFYLFFTQIT
jgi:hypothetical protein